MPEIRINGQPIEAHKDQTVLEVCRAHGIDVPCFCWHPELSIAGNCRMCLVEVEGRGLDIACNMPVSAGMQVYTDSEAVRDHRRAILQFITLNHPVDCGICDKAGECLLQDHHYAHNARASISHEPKLRAAKHVALSERIVLDNERCILCLRCTRFTAEVSKSHALGVIDRGDRATIRPVEGHRLADDPYSDNIIDLCPVGALLSTDFLHRARVWYLEPTPSVCPGCSQGCTIDVWHRKREWFRREVGVEDNTRIVRVTPRENPAVNGPWICNKARDLARILERPRATRARVSGQPVDTAQALAHARRLIAAARAPLALVSSWGSNEELEAFHRHFGARMRCVVKADRAPEPGERVEDDLLIRADKNPNTRRATELFGELAVDATQHNDLVLLWGEIADPAMLPAGVPRIVFAAWDDPAHASAEVFLPISVQTERAGHYTNHAGVVSAFAPCFERPAGVEDAASLFAQLAGPAAATP
jgi:NADH-quinone oxidoreductase subunit G